MDTKHSIYAYPGATCSPILNLLNFLLAPGNRIMSRFDVPVFVEIMMVYVGVARGCVS